MNCIKYLACILIVALAGCSSHVWNYDAELGVLVDSAAGFYANYTAASPVDHQEVILVIAEENDAFDPRAPLRGHGQLVYPMSVAAFDALAVRPDYLRPIITSGSTEDLSERQMIKLGYFMKHMDRPSLRLSAYIETEVESEGGRVGWGRPTDRLAKMIELEIERATSVAASYGATVVSDVVVFYTPRPHLVYGREGFYLFANAWVDACEE